MYVLVSSMCSCHIFSLTWRVSCRSGARSLCPRTFRTRWCSRLTGSPPGRLQGAHSPSVLLYRKKPPHLSSLWPVQRRLPSSLPIFFKLSKSSAMELEKSIRIYRSRGPLVGANTSTFTSFSSPGRKDMVTFCGDTWDFWSATLIFSAWAVKKHRRRVENSHFSWETTTWM